MIIEIPRLMNSSDTHRRREFGLVICVGGVFALVTRRG
jgi:hypothetical protein